LIYPNWTKVRRFTKNKNNKDKFFEYMFVDSGIVVGSKGESPPFMKTGKEIEIDDARKENQQLITAGGMLLSKNGEYRGRRRQQRFAKYSK
tara:strand:- start:382 stop:654 length:273 start_codon:yes stop_codon:yes gene_type:complete